MSETSKSDNRNTKARSTSKPLILTSQGHAATTVARTADPRVAAAAVDSHERAAARYSTSQGHAATTVARTADPRVAAAAVDSHEQAAACYSTSQGHAATTVARTADPLTQTAPIIHPVTASRQLSGDDDLGSQALQAVRKKSSERGLDAEALTPLCGAPTLSMLTSAVTSSWSCVKLTVGHLCFDSASTELTDLPLW